MDTAIDQAFAVMAPEAAAWRTTARARWAAQMQKPAPRAYHNLVHIAAVLECVGTWSAGRQGEPSTALLAAALYHDVIYDAKRKDNETESAKFCRAELEATGTLGEAEINKATRLIELTAGHVAAPSDTDGILLLDADLSILGAPWENYAAYAAAVRTEYAHVSDADWRKGRPAVMRTFLERDRIYQGTWDGRSEWEAQARANIAREIAEMANQAV